MNCMVQLYLKSSDQRKWYEMSSNEIKNMIIVWVWIRNQNKCFWVFCFCCANLCYRTAVLIKGFDSNRQSSDAVFWYCLLCLTINVITSFCYFSFSIVSNIWFLGFWVIESQILQQIVYRPYVLHLQMYFFSN